MLKRLSNWFRTQNRAMKERRRTRTIVRHFGSPDPTAVRIAGTDHDLSIDPTDGRVRKILLYDTARQRPKTNQQFWVDAARQYRPTVVVDVGLNYGECLLSSHYPDLREAHGFEANPSLLPYLRRTLAGHPQADRITLHHNAVSSVTGQTLHLAVDADWSGASHLAETGVPVQTVTLDDAVGPLAADERLLLKIDVEGFEPPVIEGLLKTLAAGPSILGFIEFSPTLMAQRGQNVPAYWDQLRSLFAIDRCLGPGSADRLGDVSWDRLPMSVQSKHCDLILTPRDRRCEHVDAFLAQWRQRRRAAA